MTDTEPIRLVPAARRLAPVDSAAVAGMDLKSITAFSRRELNQILSVYGRKVASGEWRDYAIDFGAETAVFSVFRRTSEVPIYRIEKAPRLARKQGAFSVITATGLILKRGPDLGRVLGALEMTVRVVV